MIKLRPLEGRQQARLHSHPTNSPDKIKIHIILKSFRFYNRKKINKLLLLLATSQELQLFSETLVCVRKFLEAS